MSLLGNEDEKIGNWGSKDFSYRGQKVGPANDWSMEGLFFFFPSPYVF